MKAIEQVQYKVGTKRSNIPHILKKLSKHLSSDGRIVYENGDRGSFAIELLNSIFADNKITKFEDEERFVSFLKKHVKIQKKYLP